MNVERFSVPFETKGLAAFSAIHEAPETPGPSSVLLANGAGFHLEAPWMERVAHGLVARGFEVLRFNYPYRERAVREGKNRPPDRREVLEAAHEAALACLRERAGSRRILLAGKSLGGRIATHLAAKDSACAGLILFGYPLHPHGKPERLRNEHFAAIAQPALFLQGTRDALCDLDLLTESLRRYGGTATVEVVEGADHGFHVLKSSGRDDDQVLEALLDRVQRWEAETFPI
jgi:predicted alpha/beta-hydrolase family hydrolase